MKVLALLISLFVFAPTLAFGEDDYGTLHYLAEQDRIRAETKANNELLNFKYSKLEQERRNTYILAFVIGLAGVAIGLGIFYGKNPDKLKSLTFWEKTKSVPQGKSR